MARRSVFNQRDAGAFHRHVGAGAHRDTDMGGGERGCAIDANAAEVRSGFLVHGRYVLFDWCIAIRRQCPEEALRVG